MARASSRQQPRARLEPIRASGAARGRSCIQRRLGTRLHGAGRAADLWGNSRTPTAWRTRPAAPALRSTSCFRPHFRPQSACDRRHRSAPTPSPSPPRRRPRAAHVRGPKRAQRAHDRCGRDDRAGRPPFCQRGREAARDRQPHARARAGTRRRDQGLRGRLEQPEKELVGCRHRGELHGERRAAHHQDAAAALAVRKRRHRPIFMVDLAVPRDIEPAVAEISDVYLFSIDDLQQIVEENRQQREAAAGDARLLLEEEVARFLAELRAHDAGPAIRALRQQADAIRAADAWSKPGGCCTRANPPTRSSITWPIPSPTG